MSSPERQFINKKDLTKVRGWTPKLIKDFLGEPDRRTENPMYKCAAPMCLYDLRKVKRIERTRKFQEEAPKAQERSRRAARAAEKRKADLLAKIEAVDVQVPVLPYEQLVRRACESYNDHKSGESDLLRATPESAPEFLDRICVNYLRHELTEYENHLESVFGKAGAEDARVEIKLRILDAISEVYPELSAECSRQVSRMFDALSWPWRR